ncbi:MAG: aldehyde dehydrogenase, partial [Halarcobacter sp.]
LPLENVLIRVSNDDTLFEAVSRILAARVAGVHFKVSIENNALVKEFLESHKADLFTSRDGLVEQSEEEMAKTIDKFDRVIYSDISKVSDLVFKKSSESLTFIVRQKPMMEGRLELLNYFIEQSISHSFHRYGNIGARELD